MTYHWQARVVDAANDASPWVSFASMPSTLPDFGIDMTPPTRPIIRSATNPNQSLWYNNSVAQLQWASRDHISGIAGYTYVLERHAHVIPPGNVVDSTAMTIRNLSDGIWILALRSVDRAGNWSPTATYRLQIDRHPVQVRWLTPQRITLNPYQGPQTVRFSVSKDAQVHVGLYRVGSRVPTQTLWYPHVGAGQVITITVTGKGPKGNPYPKGYYFFSIEAIDHANNITRTNLGGIDVRPEKPSVSATGQQLFDDGGKQIIVSLSRETLYAYDGTKLVLQTLVTTGNPNLPTPTGHFTVLAKYHPYEFVSPWPQGSPYWYPASWSQYAMLFRDGGYFLHDAPWRSAFGPGTNGPGQPGTNFGGTHGCVNIPPGPTLFLYNWAAIGTPVNVVP
jgi:lipoprotein-anchoring transpeptidase ErfK/SrfK